VIIDFKKSSLRAYLDTIICALSYEYLIKRYPFFIDSDIDNVPAVHKLWGATTKGCASRVILL